MELKILEDKKNRFVFELRGEDHTFLNVLKQELHNDKNVTVATFNIEHPLIKIPKVIIETSKENAKEALIKAIDRLKKNSAKWEELFK